MITRLAPTPSGFLHQGNIFNFLLNWLWARANGGRVLLRIDDADADRKRPAYVDDIFRVLDWLGLDWDMGPSGPDEFERHWSQHKRKDLYTALLDELAASNQLFACTCSRKEFGTYPVYPGNCTGKALPFSTPAAAWRIRLTSNTIIRFTDRTLGAVAVDLSAEAGNFVVRRKDGIAAYQLASLADDRHFGVTHIGRGADLLPSTAMQLYLDTLLRKTYLSQCFFWHHSLLKTQEDNKLSKSAGQMGQSIVYTISKEKILTDFAAWMGWGPMGNITLAEMIALMNPRSEGPLGLHKPKVQ